MLSRIENLIYKKDAKSLDEFLAKLTYQQIIEPSNVNQDSMLHLAVKHSTKEVIDVILKYIKDEDKDIINSQRLTPLQLAILENKKDVIQTMLDHGSTLETQSVDISGNILQIYVNAAKILDIDMIKYLLNNIPNLDINKPNGFGDTILDYACANTKDNSLEVIQLLLAHDATPLNLTNHSGRKNSLFHAVSSGKLETVQYLIKNYPFDLNQTYYQSNMPSEIDKLGNFNLAHIAYYRGNHEVFKFLIDLPEFHNEKIINDLSKVKKHRVPKQSLELLEQLKEKIFLESVVQANNTNKSNKI
jgi:hypothetical protein